MASSFYNMRSIRWCWALSGLLAGLFFCLSVGATSEVEVTCNGDVVRLTALSVPLDRVLQELARVTGVSIKAEGLMEERITLEGLKGTIEQVLQRVLTHHNHSVVYRRAVDGQPAAVEIQLLASRVAQKKTYYPAQNSNTPGDQTTGASSRGAFRTYTRESLVKALAVERTPSTQIEATPLPRGSSRRHRGIRIDRVDPDSVFSLIGIQNGEIVNDINRRKVRSAAELVEGLRYCLAEETAGIRIERIRKDGRYDPVYLTIEP